MKKYYIYHIVGVKIGCTVNPKQRIKKAQGYTNYEILEVHDDISVASDRELELQKEYGYKVDLRRYDKSNLKGCSNGGLKTAKNKLKREFFGGKVGYNGGKGTRENMLKVAEIGRAVMKERHGIKIDAYDYETKKYIKSFDSINDAARGLNMSSSSVASVLKGVRDKAKNYYFKKK